MKTLGMFVKLLVGTLAFLVVYFILTGRVWSQELEKYEPINVGFCKDVQLPCARLVLKGTDFFYAVFKEGRLIAITKISKGKEEVIWGKLLKPNEKEL